MENFTEKTLITLGSELSADINPEKPHIIVAELQIQQLNGERKISNFIEDGRYIIERIVPTVFYEKDTDGVRSLKHVLPTQQDRDEILISMKRGTYNFSNQPVSVFSLANEFTSRITRGYEIDKSLEITAYHRSASITGAHFKLPITVRIEFHGYYVE